LWNKAAFAKKMAVLILPMLIEIVWQKIKYEWMPFSAYESFRNLKESLFDILANIGKSYTVNFA